MQQPPRGFAAPTEPWDDDEPQDDGDDEAYFYGAPGTAHFAPSASAPAFSSASAGGAAFPPFGMGSPSGGGAPAPPPSMDQLTAMMQQLAAGLDPNFLQQLASAASSAGMTLPIALPTPPAAPEHDPSDEGTSGVAPAVNAAPAATAGKKKWASIAATAPKVPLKGVISAAEDDERKAKAAAAAVKYASPYATAATTSSSSSSAAASAPRDTRPLCSFFLQGRCLKGPLCRFRHASATASDGGRLVDFFARQMQEMSGDATRETAINRSYITTAAAAPASGTGAGNSSSAEAAAEAKRYEEEGLQWEQAQAAASSSASSLMDNPLVKAAAEAGLLASGSGAGDGDGPGSLLAPSEIEAALQLAERKVSGSITCAVCLESVLLGPTEAGTEGGEGVSSSNRRFGLLTHCPHAFCLPCIREWRGRIDLPKETTRACPICRTTSYFVIPCDRFIADPARKALVRQEYHRQQSQIPCKYFDYGKGECPFGSSCFFAHLNPDGTPYVHARPVLRLDAEGTVSAGRRYKLSEFL